MDLLILPSVLKIFPDRLNSKFILPAQTIVKLSSSINTKFLKKQRIVLLSKLGD